MHRRYTGRYVLLYFVVGVVLLGGVFSLPVDDDDLEQLQQHDKRDHHDVHEMLQALEDHHHHHHHHEGHDHGHGHDHDHSHHTHLSDHHHHHHHHGGGHYSHEDSEEVIEEAEYVIGISNAVGLSFVGTLFTSLASLIAVALIPIIDVDHLEDDPTVSTLVAFSVGSLLGDVFLHLLPHAFAAEAASGHGHHHHEHSHDHGHGHDHEHGHSHGITGLETPVIDMDWSNDNEDEDSGEEEGDDKKKTLKRRKNQKKSEKQTPVSVVQNKSRIAPVAYLNLIADAVHNFSDGMAVAAAFLVSTNVGFVTTLAVMLHELPQEIGGVPRRQALLLNFACALVALLGNAFVLVVGVVFEDVSRYILPFAGGGLLYITLADIVPTLQSKPPTLWETVKQLCAIGLGILVMMGVALFE